MKDGLLSLEAQKQDEMMFMELALRVRMRHEFDKEFGDLFIFQCHIEIKSLS